MLMVIFASIVLFVLTIALCRANALTVHVAQNVRDRAQAQMVADSGMEMGVAYLRSTSNWRTLRTPGVWVQGQPLNGGTITLTVQDGQDTDGDGIVETTGSLADASRPVTLTCVGSYGRARQISIAVVSPNGGRVDSGIIVDSTISLSTGTYVDSFDSTLGPYGGANCGAKARVATNATAKGSVSLGTGARVNGDALVGPGANPNQVISLGTGASLTGTKTAMPSVVPMPTITVPNLGPAGGAQNYATGSNNMLAQDLHVASMKLGTGSKLRICGNVTIVTEGAFSVGTGASIEVLTGSSLKVYCKGALTVSTGADNKVNGPNLTRLTLYNLSTTPATFSTGGTLQGVIVSPNAPVKLSTGFKVFGAVVAKAASLGTGTAFHEDIRITSGADPVQLSSSGGSQYAVRWVK